MYVYEADMLCSCCVLWSAKDIGPYIYLHMSVYADMC